MTILKGRYELHELIGEGGMSTVYRATQLNLEREVAIKFIKPEVAGREFIQRFEREAKAIARLNHPNITQVYDFDRAEDGKPFMVMEWMPGMDLADFLVRYAPLKTSDIITIMRGAAAALHYAHTRQIIHRDVKPSNIFITTQQHIKLMDFGLAKMVEDVGLTQTGMSLGTPRYFSPEQASGEAIDHRTDLYALGIIFFELITGKPPFEGTSLVNLAVQHMTTPVPDPLAVRPDLPAIVGTITLNLLAKNPADRYPDAMVLLRDLDQFEQESKHETGILPVIDLSEYQNLTPVMSDVPNLPAAQQPTTSSSIASTLIGRRVTIPLPLVALAAILLAVLLVIGGRQFLANDTSDESTSNDSVPLEIAPASPGEYLILVASRGDDVTLQRRIASSLQASDAVAISPHLTVRVETVDRQINTRAEAQTLANEVNAHLVVWSVQDEIGIEVVFQDIFAEPRSADTLRFIIPNAEDYTTVITEDMPIVLRHFLASMLLHHFVRTSDLDGLAGFGGFSASSTSGAELRVLPPSDLDRHILSMFLWREDDPEANVTRTVDAATAALRLVPGDPTLYFLRGFYEGFYRNDLTRARVDADKLAELLGQTNLVVWNEMNLAFVEQDYEKILELSQKLDQSVPGYGIPFSYRQTALALTGDFERIQKEIYQGEVSDQSVFGLPFWDTMGALTYEIQGDTEHYQQAVERVRTNRDLESSVSFITGIPSPPVAFYLLGGYIAELSDETLRAVLIYQSGLQIDPENYLLNWRRGVLSAKSGNIQDAYKAFQKARDNAPVPFPIAVYQQAQLIHTTPEAVPAEAPAPCELLRQARLQAKESPGFYAPLLTTIIQAEGDWACLAIYGG